MSEGSGLVARPAMGWFKTVVVATAIGGSALGASWGMWSLHVVANAVGVVTKAAPHIGSWITEGGNAVHDGPPAAPPGGNNNAGNTPGGN